MGGFCEDFPASQVQCHPQVGVSYCKWDKNTQGWRWHTEWAMKKRNIAHLQRVTTWVECKCVCNMWKLSTIISITKENTTFDHVLSCFQGEMVTSGGRALWTSPASTVMYISLATGWPSIPWESQRPMAWGPRQHMAGLGYTSYVRSTLWQNIFFLILVRNICIAIVLLWCTIDLHVFL